MAALSYMQRRASGTYEFRKRLPEALAGKPVPSHMRDGFADLVNSKTGRFKRELVRSLRTKELKEAKRRDYRAALQASKLFDDAVSALSPRDVSQLATPAPDLEELGRGVLAELLGADEAERLEGDDRRHLQTPDDRAKWPDLRRIPSSAQLGMSSDHFHVYGELLPVFESEFREAFARRDPKIVYPETNIALKQRGIYLSKTSQEFQAAALVVLEAHVRAYDAMGRRQRGEIISTPKVAPAKKELGPKLSEALTAWAAGGVAQNAKKPNANTVTEAEQAVRYFQELHGDLRLGEITREKAREFRDAVAKVPSALPRDLRKLSLPKLLERDLSGFKPRMATTVNKIVQVLGGIVSRAEREGFLDKVPNYVNPFGKAIRFSVDHHEAARKHFNKADLKAVFSSPVFLLNERPAGGGEEAAFWFPLIGLLSGMRLDEIAQLRICDLSQDEDTKRWYFDIDRTGGRSTKNSSSIRHVPVHRELKRIGLLQYRQSLWGAGHKLGDPLWPAVNAEGDRTRSSAWSKWFGRYLRSCNRRSRSMISICLQVRSRSVELMQMPKIADSVQASILRAVVTAGVLWCDSLVGYAAGFKVKIANRPSGIVAVVTRPTPTDVDLIKGVAELGASQIVLFPKDADVAKYVAEKCGRPFANFKIHPAYEKILLERNGGLHREDLDKLPQERAVEIHDLRHEAISRFFELGLTTPEVASISGHKDLTMLFRYAHAQNQNIIAKFDMSSKEQQAENQKSLGAECREV